jgi:hypothetical protein
LRIISIAAICAAGVIACGESTSPDDSTLSFTYTGATATNATTFSATGTIPPGLSESNSVGTTAWAAGAVEPAANASFVIGVVPKTSTTWDFAAIAIDRKTVGTSSIDVNCDTETATDCTGVAVFFNFQGDGDTYQYLCVLATGSVSITAVSDTHIAGTFSGSGSCFNALDAETPFTITNGAFNVELSSQLQAGQAVALKRPRPWKR